MTTDNQSALHHVVFAVAQERRAAMTQMFTALGFAFDKVPLTELGVDVDLDWNRGIELISPIPDSDATVARSVTEFLDRHGDGIYTVVLRVPDASAAATAAQRYGAATRFRQSFEGDGTYLQEVDLSVLGLPLTFLETNIP
jgi:4-hydroxyphenylpyruvate dioxygenase-like putative hemolysin